MNLSKIAGFALGPIAAAALGLLTVPLMAWFFSPEVVGQIAMLNTFLAGCSLVLTLGLDQAYVREYSEVDNKQSLLKSFLITSLICTLLFCGGIVFFSDFFSTVLFGEVSSAILIALLLACAVLSTILFRFSSLVLRMQEKGIRFSLLQISSKTIVVLGLCLLFFIQTEHSFLLAFYIVSSGLLVSVLLSLIFIKSDICSAIRAGFDYKLIVSGLKFGFPLIFAGFSFWGLTSIDRWAIRYFSGLEELGIYSIAFSFAAIMAVFQQVFSTVWAPIVYRWNKEGVKIEQFNQVTDGVVIVLVFVFCLISLASPIVHFFLPENYYQVTFLLPVCMLYPLFYTLSETTVVGMNIARKTNYSVLTTLLPCCVNFGLCTQLIPPYGTGGAGVSVALSFFCYLVLRTEVSKRVWQPFPTIKLYFFSLLILLCASWTALFKQALPWYCTSAVIVLLLMLYSSRIYQAKSFIKNYRN
ncbi:oligosaccharide flippase family protein [Pseudoalteromonas tunicata]|uniref:lipopolysaccharide biosynthesis protein n=1 Tax=Pseudoalteromonas tunicata TaxID=314281 RepID=UPI00273E8991|nr:oligosaccharide flippase family protein [Pseudoalteromonas tunicata]MDP5213583.1 oligosaccharide flippase family protein [Pseudoalteromonas tunicata]